MDNDENKKNVPISGVSILSLLILGELYGLRPRNLSIITRCRVCLYLGVGNLVAVG